MKKQEKAGKAETPERRVPRREKRHRNDQPADKAPVNSDHCKKQKILDMDEQIFHSLDFGVIGQRSFVAQHGAARNDRVFTDITAPTDDGAAHFRIA